MGVEGAPARGTRRHLASLAWGLWAVVMAVGAASLVLRYLNGSALVASLGAVERLSELLWWDVLVPASIPAFATVGAVVAARQPRNAVGWLCLALAGLVACQEAGWEYAARAFEVTPGVLPAAVAVAWFTYVFSILMPLSFVLTLLFFPDGRLPSPRWRLACWAVVAVAAVNVLAAALGPEIFVGTETELRNPAGVPGYGATLRFVVDATSAAVPVLLLVAVASVVFRWRRAGGLERLQLKWIALAGSFAAFFVICGVVGTFATGLSYPTVLLLGAGIAAVAVGVPLAIGVAVLRYRLYDVDLVINRALVYGALTACVVGIYVVVVGYVGEMFRVEDSTAVSLFAAGVVAVLFAPLRDRLQRGVNRLMYGERDEPYAVLSRLGRRLETTLAPEATLVAIVRTVAEALKLPYAAITLKRGEGFETAAEQGVPARDPLVLPLTYGAETVGQLVLAPRSPNEPLAKPDLRLLQDLARQAGVAVHAVRLTADLQRSREKLVTAREEERRRLRRDLHDGVGPQLAALTLKLETARRRLADDPEAEALLSGLADRARETVADVRRAVYALRPPALDELGLIPALRETAAQHGHQTGPHVTVDAPTSLPPLPAAVEVACFRIAGEAMTNAARHADAQTCTVRIALDKGTDALLLDVSDDGRGIGERRGAGVGLHSMRERAEELGGTLTIAPVPSGGTRIQARLPLPEAAENIGETRAEAPRSQTNGAVPDPGATGARTTRENDGARSDV